MMHIWLHKAKACIVSCRVVCLIDLLIYYDGINQSQCLEKANPTLRPAFSGLVDGKWRLLYSNAPVSSGGGIYHSWLVDTAAVTYDYSLCDVYTCA